MLNKGTIGAFFLLFLVGCSEPKHQSSISFIPLFNMQKLQCDKALSIDENAWHLGQMQFFISQLALQDRQGQWHEAQLMTTPEQTEEVALIGENCRSKQPGNWQVKFNSSTDFNEYKKVRFSLGVPFELNHLNPLTQPSPLNVSSMFWVWQTGHKFVRIELENQNNDWLFHLGSVGCQSASVMRSPQEACRYPNLFNVDVVLNDSKQIYFDLSALIANIKLATSTSCQSEHDNLACQQLFDNLNNSGSQAVFRSVIGDTNSSVQTHIEQTQMDIKSTEQAESE